MWRNEVRVNVKLELIGESDESDVVGTDRHGRGGLLRLGAARN
ncbi:MAG TPA: hypothetical protein VMZ27_01460 [Candidatus Saccharimonadales bacterium]|nr:hypothetical protein [Candidatus Saccharimonadales bacterium]